MKVRIEARENNKNKGRQVPISLSSVCFRSLFEALEALILSLTECSGSLFTLFEEKKRKEKKRKEKKRKEKKKREIQLIK